MNVNVTAEAILAILDGNITWQRLALRAQSRISHDASHHARFPEVSSLSEESGITLVHITYPCLGFCGCIGH